MNVISFPRVVLLSAAVCLSAVPTSSVRAQSRVAELDSVLAVLHADGLFEGVMVIAEDGVPAYRAAYGTYEGERLTTQTPLPLSSVTKPLTAMPKTKATRAGYGGLVRAASSPRPKTARLRPRPPRGHAPVVRHGTCLDDRPFPS